MEVEPAIRIEPDSSFTASVPVVPVPDAPASVSEALPVSDVLPAPDVLLPAPDVLLPAPDVLLPAPDALPASGLPQPVRQPSINAAAPAIAISFTVLFFITLSSVFLSVAYFVYNAILSGKPE